MPKTKDKVGHQPSWTFFPSAVKERNISGPGNRQCNNQEVLGRILKQSFTEFFHMWMHIKKGIISYVTSGQVSVMNSTMS